MPLEELLSTMTKRESKELERGKSVMKSMETDWKGKADGSAGIGMSGGEVG